MKKYLLYALVLTLSFITGCHKTTDSPKEGTFTALTYNVAGLPQGANVDQFPVEHMPLISPRLNYYDLINVQEDFYYHDVLIKEDHHPYKSTYVANKGFGDGLNMFSDFIFLNYMRTGWADCNGTDCFTPKGFTYSRLKLTSEAYIDIYNVHCNAGSDVLDLDARRKNILQLCKYIEYRSKGNAVIIMGDTNCRYTRIGDNIREILDRGFTDVWVELERNGVLPIQDGNSLTDCDPLSTLANCEVVDKIFYRSNDVVKLTPLEFSIPGDKFLDGSGEWLSDHRPLLTKFKFNVLK